jgi:hypothetical protein
VLIAATGIAVDCYRPRPSTDVTGLLIAYIRATYYCLQGSMNRFVVVMLMIF